VTVLVLRVAFVVIVNVAVAEVELVTDVLLTDTPVGDTENEVPFVVKLVPVRVTVKAVPRTPAIGVIEVSVGAGGLLTVNGWPGALLCPPGVVTRTLWTPIDAPGATAKVALTVVLFTTLMALGVTPDTVIADVQASPVPVRVSE
jgi:hypothetical protein